MRPTTSRCRSPTVSPAQKADSDGKPLSALFLKYQTPMRYFFHILDGATVFYDKVGSTLSSPEIAISQAKLIAAELCKAGELCRSHLVFVLDANGKNIFRCRVDTSALQPGAHDLPMTPVRSKKSGLTPRGCLVRVTGGTGNHPIQRWFAVGIYFQKMAEAAICDLPQIDPTDVVFAYRRLQPSEIETLGLRRGQIILCDGPQQIAGGQRSIAIAGVDA